MTDSELRDESQTGVYVCTRGSVNVGASVGASVSRSGTI
jgi:hypothetical protein